MEVEIEGHDTKNREGGNDFAGGGGEGDLDFCRRS